MKHKVNYLLVGTGVAPLLAAQRLVNRGETVAILNPERDFFLENSEMSLDLLNFQTTNSDLSRRFSNNLPDQVYRDMVHEFPGAIEMWKEEDELKAVQPFRVLSAPWVRQRHRLWAASERSFRAERVESLYLRALDLGWKPQWLEGLSLARRFPGVSLKKFDQRNSEKWVGFLGPRFGDVDVERYRIGLLEFVRERLGRRNLMTAAHILGMDTKGVRFQLASGLPLTIEVGRSMLFFWTPKLERFLGQMIQKYDLRLVPVFQDAVVRQRWEEWEVLSRDPINSYVVGHFEGMRVWANGEGVPPPGGWNQLKIMRREIVPGQFLSATSFNDLSGMLFRFMGWDRYSVRKVGVRIGYRWNQSQPMDLDADGLHAKIILACDGPIHWIAKQVRQAIDGV